MKVERLPPSYWDKILSGQIRVYCNHCEAATWHVKHAKKKYRKGFSPVWFTFYTCEICNNISPYFDSRRYQGQYMKEFKKVNVRVTCPKCKGRFFYSSKLKGSKCKKCGYFLPLNAVIEI